MVNGRMKSKKSVEWGLTTIMVAALVLGILVMSFYMITNGFQKLSKTVNSCEQAGGKCVGDGKCENQRLDFQCPSKQECCSNVGGLT